MKIFIYANVWGSGGIEKNFVEILTHNGQGGMRYEYVIVAAAHTDNIYDKAIIDAGHRFIFLESQMGETIKRRVTLARRLKFIYDKVREERPDIMHINLSSGLAFLYGHIVKKANPKCRVIVHAHGDGIEPPLVLAKNIFYRLCRLCYEKEVDFCIACSEQIRDWMFSIRAIHSGRCQVIHYAIDTEKFRFDPVARRKYRAEILGSDECYIIGTIGRISYQKNPHFIVDIVKELKQRGLDFKFLWIGEGEDEPEIKEKVKNLDLNSRIIFYGVTDKIPEMLSAMDVFILPSRFEGLAIVLIEAQASGLPVLGSDTLSYEANLSDKYHILPLDDLKAWCDDIMNTVCDNLTDRTYPKEELETLGFSLESNVEKIKKLYDIGK